MSTIVHPVLLYIPVLLTWLALHVMEDGWLAAPEDGVSVENMEEQYVHKEWYSAVLQQMKRNVGTQALLNSSPGVSLELNQTWCSSVRVLQTLPGFKVQVISV